MFFKSKLKKAEDAVVDAIAPTIGSIQAIHGIPAGFWQNPYVLGYLTVQITMYVMLLGGDNLSRTDTASTITKCLSRLSLMNGAAIANLANKYAEANDPDFDDGLRNGKLCLLYMFDRVADEETNLDVQAAKEATIAMRKAPSRENILGMLLFMLWNDEVTSRFGLR